MRTRSSAWPLLTAAAFVALVVATTTCTSSRPADNSSPATDPSATPATDEPSSPEPDSPEPASGEPDSPEPASGEPDSPDPASGDSATPSEPGPDDSAALPKQGKACPDGRCAGDLRCLEYYGIAGARGPKFSSCEIPCGKGGSCPDGQRCVTIADGPGQVCR